MTIEPSVLIVILNYGTYDLTLQTVDNIRNTIDYKNYSILVIDNNSPNDSAVVLEKESKKGTFSFIQNNINSGYAAGNNIGIRYGIKNGFDYSWILNNDVVIQDRNALTHMVEVIQSNEKIGCIGPKINTLDGEICPPYCRRPNLFQMTIGIPFEKKYRKKYNDVSRMVYRVYGCCMLLKNSVMDKIGCMDERTFLYGEEQILAERLYSIGVETFYDSYVSVLHKESMTMKRMSSNKKMFQIKTSWKSRTIYLREYRKYSLISTFICNMFRSIVTMIR